MTPKNGNDNETPDLKVVRKIKKALPKTPIKRAHTAIRQLFTPTCQNILSEEGVLNDKKQGKNQIALVPTYLYEPSESRVGPTNDILTQSIDHAVAL